MQPKRAGAAGAAFESLRLSTYVVAPAQAGAQSVPKHAGAAGANAAYGPVSRRKHALRAPWRRSHRLDARLRGHDGVGRPTRHSGARVPCSRCAWVRPAAFESPCPPTHTVAPAQAGGQSVPERAGAAGANAAGLVRWCRRSGCFGHAGAAGRPDGTARRAQADAGPARAAAGLVGELGGCAASSARAARAGVLPAPAAAPGLRPPAPRPTPRYSKPSAAMSAGS